MSRVLVLVLWVACGIALPAIHLAADAVLPHSEGGHGEEQGAGFRASCPLDCDDLGHDHAGHDHATCTACRILHAPADVRHAGVTLALPVVAWRLALDSHVAPSSVARSTRQPRGPPSRLA